MWYVMKIVIGLELQLGYVMKLVLAWIWTLDMI